jgi:hypothetical protein
LRQQMAIVQRKTKRPRLTQADRAFWVALCGLWPVARLAQRPDHCETRDRNPLASQGLQALLDLEEPTQRRTSAKWTGQQLVNAFPDDSAPKYVIRDRDKIYGANFVRRVRAMGTEQVLTAPQSPWQNPYCERELRALRGVIAGAAKQLAHVEPSATHLTVRVLSSGSPSRSSQLISRDGQRF